MVNYSPPTVEDEDKWSRGMTHVVEDCNGKEYFDQFVRKRKISFPRGECRHFLNFKLRPITCNFK